ncbi:MAG: metal ABC transporter ATP-binding protein [Candidatus Micrarchaeota archaeon]|nr:metal ABC transporter ATP-binding protein [Candidatus Micrarchaeota archaeon]
MKKEKSGPAGPGPAPIVSLDHLSHSYGGQPVLDDVSLRLMPGEFAGLIGPNGAGKTTLLKILLGLIRPARGAVRFDCSLDDCAHLAGQGCRPCIGYVPQRAAVFEGGFPATVREVVEMGLYGQKGLLHSLNKSDHAAVEEAMNQAGLAGLSDRRISDLSGGQQQRVFIARALAARPHLLIFDEPTTGVDAIGEQDFYKLLNHLNRTHGITILLVLHDVEMLSRYARRIVCLNRRICFDGPSDSITHTRLHELLGRQAPFYP